jgi:hypothetical protein
MDFWLFDLTTIYFDHAVRCEKTSQTGTKKLFAALMSDSVGDSTTAQISDVSISDIP